MSRSFPPASAARPGCTGPRTPPRAWSWPTAGPVCGSSDWTLLPSASRAPGWLRWSSITGTSVPATASHAVCSPSLASSPTVRPRSPTLAVLTASTRVPSRSGGVSSSGGHVIEVAARDSRIAAVVARGAVRRRAGEPVAVGWRHAVGLTVEVSATASAPWPAVRHTVPSVGPPVLRAVMNLPHAEPGYRALNPPGLAWPNEAAARIALRAGSYRPTRKVARVRLPDPFRPCRRRRRDTSGPGRESRGARPARRGAPLPRWPLRSVRGRVFERVVADETEFLVRHLGV